ncbi:anti-sigma factor RsbA family regulatory protein [Actinomadura sp.]|uniref:anti-sigma factor RsbA family regulatory protein n=1 Tax=Actinomadura sp. TaxID=1989 RepID=UPI0037C76280
MTLEHRAFMYDGADDFLSVTVPYLRSGLERDEAVIAVAREPNLTALRDVLGDKEIVYVDSAGFYRHPVHTLRDYQNIVREHAPRSVCAVAEPVWDGWDERQTLEWIRYESLINVVFEDADARALCPYDTRALPPRILAEARRTHPKVLAPGHDGDSAEYVDPVVFGSTCDRGLRADRPHDAEYLPVNGADLHHLRSFVAEQAGRTGLGEQAAQNLVTAVNEVAANALQHGTPPVGLWTWQDGTGLVCEVGDHGFWRPDPLTGYIPPESALQSGFGLWTVRLLVDLMELRAGWDGTFVRLHKRP